MSTFIDKVNFMASLPPHMNADVNLWPEASTPEEAEYAAVILAKLQDKYGPSWPKLATDATEQKTAAIFLTPNNHA